MGELEVAASRAAVSISSGATHSTTIRATLAMAELVDREDRVV